MILGKSDAMEKKNLVSEEKGFERERKEFLMHMYDQMFNDINRHILVVWQSVGVVIGAFALFGLVERAILPLDVAAGLIILIGLWLLVHLEDAGYWYNRNLTIIANIERQFLRKSDLRNIQYYFGKHRAKNVMLTHLRIQYLFGIGIVSLVLLYHFLTRVLPGFGSPWANFEPLRCLPYVILIIGGGVVFRIRRKMKKKYAEFLENSPGIDVDTEGIRYGEGHPADE